MTKDEIRELINATSEIASIVTNYYFELKQLGHTDENAIKLTLSLQDSILKLGQQPKD